jgi:hypothetical protein
MSSILLTPTTGTPFFKRSSTVSRGGDIEKSRRL